MTNLLKTIAFATLAIAALAPTLPAAAAQVTLTDIPTRITIPTDHPNHETNTHNAANASCDSQIGYLPKVDAAEVMGIDDGRRVWVTELCPSGELTLMRNEGNAGKVRQAIADNDVIMDKLDRATYSEQDVYGVKMMGDDTINLFVYRFTR